jgi:TPP-dependent pyruvate/acetoin dehydrogenase alpha subunit
LFQNSSSTALQLAEDMSPKPANKKPAEVSSLISDAKLQQLYAMMLKCRILDSHARKLKGGPSWKGKEAAAIGASIDLRPEDTIVSSLDPAVASFLKGMPLRTIFSESARRSSSENKAAASAGRQAQSAVATGIAFASNAKGGVTVAFLSGSPEGCEAEREALRFAGLQKLPIIYVYSGWSAESAQLNSYRFPVIPVDGGDVVAVYRVAHECTVRAREGGGPSVIACILHSANGSASSNDPLRNMERYLSAKGLFREERKQSTIRAFEKLIATAMKSPQQRKSAPELQRMFAL